MVGSRRLQMVDMELAYHSLKKGEGQALATSACPLVLAPGKAKMQRVVVVNIVNEQLVSPDVSA